MPTDSLENQLPHLRNPGALHRESGFHCVFWLKPRPAERRSEAPMTNERLTGQLVVPIRQRFQHHRQVPLGKRPLHMGRWMENKHFAWRQAHELASLEVAAVVQKQECVPVSSYLPGLQNILPDALSRGLQSDHREWSLLRVIAPAMFLIWGTARVDLFATQHSSQLPVFSGLFSNPGCTRPGCPVS